MKKSCILLILAIFIFPFLTHASSFGISRPVNTLGLVGYWTFDGKDVVNGVSMDRSGNGNNGNLLNISTSTFYAQGKIGQGFNFDGVDDYVSAPDNNSLDFGTGNFSISMWVRPTVTGVLGFFYSKFASNSTGPGFFVRMNGAGWETKITDGTNSANPRFGSATFVAGKWTHIVYTVDRSQVTGVTGYANGVSVACNGNCSYDMTTIGSIDNTVLPGIGSRNGIDPGSYFNGSIDDVRIYNRVLSQAEITQLYNTGASNKTAVSPKVNATSNCSVGLSCGLVGYWTLDGKDTNWGTNTVNDLSGNGNTGTISGMSTTSSPVVGKVGQGLRFDGNGQYITMGNTSSLQINGDITLCTWAYPKDISRFIFAKSDGGTRDYGMYISGSQFLTLFTSGGGTSGTRTITFNTWHHLCITVRSTAVTFYIDGSGEAGGSSASVTNSNKQFSLGRDGSSPGFDYNGFLDDTRVYNRALSATEIKSLYSQGASTKFAVSPKIATTTCSLGLSCGLVGYWTFDGKDTNWGTNRTTDMSGNSNTGTMVNMSTTSSPVVGKMGQGLWFDGVDDYVNVSNNTILNSYPITISAWIKTSVSASNNNEMAIVNKYFTSSLNGYNLYVRNGNIEGWYYVDTNNKITQTFGTAGSRAVNNNLWHHIVYVVDSSGLNIYVDGTSRVTKIWAGTPAVTSTTQPLSIGTYGGGTNYFPGLIDDVRIYNRALSQAEITQLYNIGR